MVLSAKAIQYRRPLKTSVKLEQFLAQFIEQVPLLKSDAYLSPVLQKAKSVLFG
jgi:histidine ammonia-lyase